ncbi:MAG: mechanosensitive ion channel family protein [Bacteroidales bacterium]|nr:mechanosensitive ion channel family protein [Bacteroidales bacterium]
MKEIDFITQLKAFFTNVLFENVPRILIALVVLWIGWKLIKWFTNLLKRVYNKRKYDESLQSFLNSLINITLKTLLIITVAGMMGIQMTSFIAILGAAGLAIGMALQGTLQNFAGGVIILLLKPYKVGDVIEQGSYCGTVKSIQIFNTILCTPDNKVIIIPNTQLATGSLINYTQSDKRRVDVSVGIAYGESIEKARDIMLELAHSRPEILQGENAPEVVVTNLGPSAINLQLHVWVKTADYWVIFTSMNQGIYEKLSENNVEIPFDQLQVHIKQ